VQLRRHELAPHVFGGVEQGGVASVLADVLLEYQELPTDLVHVVPADAVARELHVHGER
jgi:hypothetical protein